MLIILMIPTILDFLISDVLNISRRLDFFIILGFTFLTGVVFKSYVIIRKTQNKVERLIRKIAIKGELKKK